MLCSSYHLNICVLLLPSPTLPSTLAEPNSMNVETYLGPPSFSLALFQKEEGVRDDRLVERYLSCMMNSSSLHLWEARWEGFKMFSNMESQQWDDLQCSIYDQLNCDLNFITLFRGRVNKPPKRAPTLSWIVSASMSNFLDRRGIQRRPDCSFLAPARSPCSVPQFGEKARESRETPSKSQLQGDATMKFPEHIYCGV